MEERLHQRVIGQDEAVSAVAKWLRRSRTGLQDPNRPIGRSSSSGRLAPGARNSRGAAEFMFDDDTRWSDRL